MTTEAVLFDMDGVIVNSEDYWVELEEEHIYPEVMADPVSADETTGMNYREIYDYLDERYEMTADKAAFVDRYDEVARTLYTETVALMDGFDDLVADLRERGVAVALVSSSPHDWIDRVRERFGLAFDAVVSAEDIDGPGKPEPDIYRYAADVLGVDPAACVAVEDSENGVAAASAAGMRCVGFRSTADQDLDLSAADAVVESPEALRAELLG